MAAIALRGGSLQLTSHEHVSRVADVPVRAYARGSVVVSNAERVGSALNLAAGVHAFPDAPSELEADVSFGAVQIVLALAEKLAAGFLVLRIACVSWRAQTLSSNTASPRTALDVVARVLAPTSLAVVSKNQAIKQHY